MLAVRVAARALPVSVDVCAEVAGHVAVLRQAAVDERRRLVVLRRDHRRIAMRQAVAQLVHRNRPHDAALEQRHQAHRLRHLAFRIEDRVAIGDDLDRRQHGHRMRQVGPDILQQARAQRRLERRDVGIDRTVHELRCRAAEIHHHPVALHGDGARDLLQRVFAQARIHELQHARRAVGQLTNAAAHLRFDVFQVRAQRADQRVTPILVEQRDDPLAQAQHRVQLHLHVLELQARVAHRVLQERDEVALQLEVLDDLERRHLDAFVVLALGLGRQTARSVEPFSPSWIVDDSQHTSSPL